MAERLICILEHPTQYDPPLWSCMARRGNLEPVVWYLRGSAPLDEEIERTGSWELPVERTFLAEVIDSREIMARLKKLSPRAQAILTAGWTRKLTWRVMWAGKCLGIAVILPSDKINEEPIGWKIVTRPMSLFHRLKNRWCFDGFVTTGSLGVKALESAGVNKNRIARGLYPVDVEWWQKSLANQKDRSKMIRDLAGTNSFVVLAVAKWSERENPLLILDSFARLRQELRGAYLVLVGDGPLRPAVEEKIQELSLRAYVHCPGYVRYQDLAAYYGAADVFIHVPSDAAWELSVPEAMACGVPVVATTNVGAAHDLVISGLTGELASPGDSEELSKALKSIADANGKRETMRAAALKQAWKVDVQTASAELETLVARLRAENRAGERG